MPTVSLNLDLWPTQLAAFETTATEILFGGASEGGKSHFSRVLLTVASLHCQNLSSVLIRKRYEDILNNHLYGDYGFIAMLRDLTICDAASITQKGIKFRDTGSVISFQHVQDERQFTSAQGVERDIVVIDEATQISERLIRIFRAWCRMTNEKRSKLPPFWRERLPRILYPSNPVGPSVGFFRRHFVKARPEGVIEEVDGFRRQYIRSRASDNQSVDLKAHKARLDAIGDKALARALDEGDWDAPVGEFFPEFDEDRHVIPDLQPPAYLLHFRTFDWGTADPACCHWWVVSDGEPLHDLAGRKHHLPRGSLICYREWYVADPERPAVGLRLRNEDLAYGILERSPLSHERRIPTLTDSLPFQDRGGLTIAETFANCGVLLTLADTSRVPGWSQVRSRLIGIQQDSNDPTRSPLLYFTESCRAARDYLPALPRHPSESRTEDAAEHGEATHAADSVRYAALSHARVFEADRPDPDPRDLSSAMTWNDMLERHTVKRRNDHAEW